MYLYLPLEEGHGLLHTQGLLRGVEQLAEVRHHLGDGAQPPKCFDY